VPALGSTDALAATSREGRSTPAAPAVSGLSPIRAATALAQAAATGKPVAATALTTPTQVAVASPDGTMTMTFDASPVRARRGDGTWVPVDTTLVVSGGVVVSRAAAVRMAFSDGASTAPLATMTQGAAVYGVVQTSNMSANMHALPKG
jgi:hypothetical protein